MAKKMWLVFEAVLVVILIWLVARYINGRYIKANAEVKPKYVAIIIDDFGNASKGTEEMLSLPIAFTGAVMSNMPYSAEEAKRLEENGKGVILHQAMEAHTGKRSWLGPTPILAQMGLDEVKTTFEQGIENVGVAKGFNNHMGSKITEDRDKMRVLLEVAKEKGFFFVDSVTTGKSVAGEVAKEVGVPYIERDVFLDSTQDLATVEKNLIKTGDIALEKGYAVAIGHVGAEGGMVTYNAIKNRYKELEDKGIKFVSAEELVRIVNNVN